jgi:hypothetical protein
VDAEGRGLAGQPHRRPGPNPETGPGQAVNKQPGLMVGAPVRHKMIKTGR